MARFDSQNEKRFYFTEIVSTIVGTTASLYLLIQHTRLTAGIQDGASFCSLGQYVDCDIVNGSRYAELLGIPLGAWGACYFFIALTMTLLATPRDKTFRFAQAVLGWLALLGVGADIFYLGVQLFALKTICLMCLLIYVCNALLLYSAVRLTPGVGSRLRNLLFENRTWVRPHLKNPRLILTLTSWVLFTVIVLLLPAQILKKSANYTHAENAIEQFFAQWKDRPSRTIEATEGNGVFGEPKAKIVVVEFSDFECPHCRKAAFTLHTLIKPLRDRIHFIFKNFPLDPSCNPAVPYQIHAHACKLAKLSVCAQLKGRFWEVHDHLFLKLDEEDLKKGFDHILESLKKVFSQTEIQTCLEDQKINNLIAEDIKLGQSLNVRHTPFIFINGKQVSIPITLDSLRKLIDLEQSLVIGNR